MFELNIDTRIASVKRREKITAGSVGIQCRFAFSAEWDGLGKTAVFETDKRKIAVVLNTPAVTIPWEVCEEADLDVIVGVYGTNGEGTIVIPTIYAKLGTVAVGATTDDADNAQTPTATDVQQILSASANAVSTANTANTTADEAKSIAQSVEQRANAGEFDGKDGAPLTVADRVYHGSTERPGWETLIFSDGSELEVKSGKNGVDGQTPYIGLNGNWWIPGKPSTNTIVPAIDTGKPSRGENGADGAPGRDGAPGAPGRDGIDGTSVSITDISESTASGGTSVVTFSDGKTLHVRNGLDGQGGSGSDVTKDTVRGWGFAYQNEIPDIEQLTKDKDATDGALADVLIGSGYTAAHGRTIEQGSFSYSSGGKLYSGSAVYTKRVRTASAYAYTAGQTYICADGYKLQMLYYGKAEKQGATQNTTTFTGKYTGWSRVITFPPLEYVAFVIKADDDREIAVADVTDKIYKYVPPTIPEPVTDQHIIDVINAAFPNAEGVGF